MSTADRPQTDGRTRRVNRAFGDISRILCADAPEHRRSLLPLVEFALSNAVHASTGHTPFYANGLTLSRSVNAITPWFRAY